MAPICNAFWRASSSSSVRPVVHAQRAGEEDLGVDAEDRQLTAYCDLRASSKNWFASPSSRSRLRYPTSWSASQMTTASPLFSRPLAARLPVALRPGAARDWTGSFDVGSDHVDLCRFGRGRVRAEQVPGCGDLLLCSCLVRGHVRGVRELCVQHGPSTGRQSSRGQLLQYLLERRDPTELAGLGHGQQEVTRANPHASEGICLRIEISPDRAM